MFDLKTNLVNYFTRKKTDDHSRSGSLAPVFFSKLKTLMSFRISHTGMDTRIASVIITNIFFLFIVRGSPYIRTIVRLPYVAKLCQFQLRSCKPRVIDISSCQISPVLWTWITKKRWASGNDQGHFLHFAIIDVQFDRISYYFTALHQKLNKTNCAQSTCTNFRQRISSTSKPTCDHVKRY